MLTHTHRHTDTHYAYMVCVSSLLSVEWHLHHPVMCAPHTSNERINRNDANAAGTAQTNWKTLIEEESESKRERQSVSVSFDKRRNGFEIHWNTLCIYVQCIHSGNREAFNVPALFYTLWYMWHCERTVPVTQRIATYTSYIHIFNWYEQWGKMDTLALAQCHIGDCVYLAMNGVRNSPIPNPRSDGWTIPVDLENRGIYGPGERENRHGIAKSME